MLSIRVRVSRAERAELHRLAAAYRCSVDELAKVALEELLTAHARRPRRTRRQATVKPTKRTPRTRARRPASKVPRAKVVTAARTYKAKDCVGCGSLFTPTGARSSLCLNCREGQTTSTRPETVKPAPPVHAARKDDEFETVWNGGIARAAAAQSTPA